MIFIFIFFLQNRINNGNLAQQQHPTNNGATVICLPDEAGNGTARLRPQSTKDSGLETENEMLKNEVRSLNTEVSLLLGRAKNAEKGNIYCILFVCTVG